MTVLLMAGHLGEGGRALQLSGLRILSLSLVHEVGRVSITSSSSIRITL